MHDSLCFYSSIGLISILLKNSSLGKNGARSSNGGETNVPSSNLLVADFGSNFCSVVTNTSQMQEPFISNALCTVSSKLSLLSQLKYG